MVTKRLQESGSPKQARPVATDSANGPLMLLHLREQRCGHHPAASPAGPLALTLGAPADDDACRRCDEALRGSRYLRPAMELLRDAVSAVGGGGDDDESAGGGSEDEATHRDMRLRAAATGRRVIQAKNDGGTGGAVQAKLLGLLSELESRQEHYFQELSRVASSFEPVLGAAATAGYTSLMSRAMTRHFGNLRRAILRKLATLWVVDEDSEEEEEDGDEYDYDPARRQEDMVGRLVRRTKQAAAARAAEQVCKPMRVLPEESVAVLRAWLFNHFLDPYPSDNEKLRLAVSTGLSRRQISNWFINARVRLWKPMIEEMYADEFSEDSSAVSSRDDGDAAASSQ
ncbi:BEL1-like homeodomain protein 11 isoform X2 [Hordeum vulgare subsp. vulgare]|uniref:Homeobox domain-containing protein n=1 Tax=Hordeum vulgare subsp. vulgare TaxID=112509 RepID=A0A8I6YA24_HORVV|nr:BEL1-like homeodomain protein 11 isoform X2 [Hordeum vulgare subsp. vulgare]